MRLCASWSKGVDIGLRPARDAHDDLERAAVLTPNYWLLTPRLRRHLGHLGPSLAQLGFRALALRPNDERTRNHLKPVQ